MPPERAASHTLCVCAIEVDEDALPVGELQLQCVAVQVLADVHAALVHHLLNTGEQRAARFVAWTFRHIIPPVLIVQI